MCNITKDSILEFERKLLHDEKAPATIKKYGKAVRDFAKYLNGAKPTKELLMEYRNSLIKCRKPQTVNGILAAIHAYFDHFAIEGIKVKLLKVQHQPFVEESRELTEAEYKRLLGVAQKRGNERLYILMMTLCTTGIRVSELVHITVEAAARGKACIQSKGKCRTVMVQRDMAKKLLAYAKRRGISTGQIFVSKSGKPLDRANICHDMKKLCDLAGVDKHKVFPHNLRHLFARCFFAVDKNLAHLADVLGHCRLETTRIYVAVSAAQHLRTLNKMRLIL